MSQAAQEQPAEEAAVCPDCGQELWYDEEEACWVCDECGIEFYEEEWEEFDEDEDELEGQEEDKK